MLSAPLAPGKSITVESYAVLTHQLVPKPREVAQGDPQRVLLTASQHVLAPYPIASESTQARRFTLACSSYCLSRNAQLECSCSAAMNFTFLQWPPIQYDIACVHVKDLYKVLQTSGNRGEYKSSW